MIKSALIALALGAARFADRRLRPAPMQDKWFLRFPLRIRREEPARFSQSWARTARCSSSSVPPTGDHSARSSSLSWNRILMQSAIAGSVSRLLATIQAAC